MRIERIDVLLKLCTEEIERRPVAGSPMESVDPRIKTLLVQGLLVNICSEFEGMLKELMNERVRALHDDDMRGHAIKPADKIFRSASVDKIERALKEFGENCIREFNRLKDENRIEYARRAATRMFGHEELLYQDELPAFEAYESIVANRNRAAHGDPFFITFEEVCRFYKCAHVLLDWFNCAIWINVDE